MNYNFYQKELQIANKEKDQQMVKIWDIFIQTNGQNSNKIFVDEVISFLKIAPIPLHFKWDANKLFENRTKDEILELFDNKIFLDEFKKNKEYFNAAFEIIRAILNTELKVSDKDEIFQCITKKLKGPLNSFRTCSSFYDYDLTLPVTQFIENRIDKKDFAFMDSDFFFETLCDKITRYNYYLEFTLNKIQTSSLDDNKKQELFNKFISKFSNDTKFKKTLSNYSNEGFGDYCEVNDLKDDLHSARQYLSSWSFYSLTDKDKILNDFLNKEYMKQTSYFWLSLNKNIDAYTRTFFKNKFSYEEFKTDKVVFKFEHERFVTIFLDEIDIKELITNFTEKGLQVYQFLSQHPKLAPNYVNSGQEMHKLFQMDLTDLVKQSTSTTIKRPS